MYFFVGLPVAPGTVCCGSCPWWMRWKRYNIGIIISSDEAVFVEALALDLISSQLGNLTHQPRGPVSATTRRINKTFCVFLIEEGLKVQILNKTIPSIVFQLFILHSAMCYSAGSINQAVNPCPMCKVFAHPKCVYLSCPSPLLITMKMSAHPGDMS